MTMTSKLHHFAEIHASARFGDGCTVWQFATICENTEIGPGVVVGSNAWIGRGCRIAAGTRIQHGAFIPNFTTIGKDVFIGPNASLTDDRLPRAGAVYCPAPPTLGDGCSIGAGAVILPGVHIGRHAMIGAGAVVSQDVPPYALFVGVPARAVSHDKPKE
jgi:UDP-2-acetamido-3-amino-2,3-dideoxy-glucuronate N-acetyltransferase